MDKNRPSRPAKKIIILTSTGLAVVLLGAIQRGVEKTGFVVPKEDIEKALRTKLSQIGLNTQEINDVLEYWLPKLVGQNKPFYRLSFLQNGELDQLFTKARFLDSCIFGLGGYRWQD